MVGFEVRTGRNKIINIFKAKLTGAADEQAALARAYLQVKTCASPTNRRCTERSALHEP